MVFLDGYPEIMDIIYLELELSIPWLLILLFGFFCPCGNLCFIEDTCQTQLMLETAVSHGQQDVSAECIGFLFNTIKYITSN